VCVQVKSISKEMEEHQAYKPKGSKAKHSDLKVLSVWGCINIGIVGVLYWTMYPWRPSCFLQNWFDKYEFLQFEINRFQIYYASLTSNLPLEFNAPLPSGLVPSPSISTLATPGSSELMSWKSLTPPHSPPSRNKLSGHGSKGGSPLLTSRGHPNKGAS
jgi:hypothetical protein